MNGAHADLGWIGETQKRQPEPEPLRPWPGAVTAPTVFLPLEPAAPVLPPPAFRRFELKPEPCLSASQRDQPALRAAVRSDRSQGMQRTRAHQAADRTRQVQAATGDGRCIHADTIPRSGDKA